ncbi:MAG TPA: helix-turn-helix transcriptional regulator [bacterium]|nr:helix-turn-helix transcriptional regulator [bacterium]
MIARRPRLRLSPREREIAALVAAGHPSKTIAAMLGISVWTVMTHLRRVYARFGVQSRAAMVATLAAGGLLDLTGVSGSLRQVSDRMKPWMPSPRSNGSSRRKKT